MYVNVKSVGDTVVVVTAYFAFYIKIARYRQKPPRIIDLTYNIYRTHLHAYCGGVLLFRRILLTLFIVVISYRTDRKGASLILINFH